MAREKTHQFVLTATECRLFRHLRELEADFETEYPMIHNGADVPELNNPLTLSLKLGGCELESFNVNGSYLLEDCATLCIKIVQKLLTTRNRHFDNVRQSDMPEKSSYSAPSTERTSWEVFKQEVIPSYVKTVSFTVAQHDLTPDRQVDFELRFPNVSISQEPSYCNHANETEAQNDAEQFSRQAFNSETAPTTTSITSTKPISLDTCIATAAEVVPTTPLTAITAIVKPSLLSRMSVAESEIRIKGVASEIADSVDTSPSKIHNKSPILSIADRIGLELSMPGKVIHAMWIQWQNKQEVKSFAAVRKLINLEQFYSNLVTLYILAYHKKEFDICFSVLLRFQSTNYTYKNGLPDLATAVLAFQYLPEENDLCRWVATLFAFLWGTQQYQSHEHLLADFPQVDSDAFSRFIFAIAHIRDPFTKGHNTAVLDQWCEVHHHKENDAEETLCKKMYGSMKDHLDKIRSEEAEREYDEAKKLVDTYVKKLRYQSSSKEATQSKSLGNNKRKAESPLAQSQKKYKRDGGRGRDSQAFS